MIEIPESKIKELILATERLGSYSRDHRLNCCLAKGPEGELGSFGKHSCNGCKLVEHISSYCESIGSYARFLLDRSKDSEMDQSRLEAFMHLANLNDKLFNCTHDMLMECCDKRRDKSSGKKLDQMKDLCKSCKFGIEVLRVNTEQAEPIKSISMSLVANNQEDDSQMEE